MNNICVNCKFYDKYGGDGGSCKRRSPVIFINPPDEDYIYRNIAQWPSVNEHNWCGDYEEATKYELFTCGDECCEKCVEENNEREG